MTIDQAISVVREALIVALMISTPILMVGLVIGLLVSLFQAVTQIQEQTLSFVPKIIAMGICTVLIVPWVGLRLIEFAERMFAP
jgi:flagellar biosynthetic protein FliQ